LQGCGSRGKPGVTSHAPKSAKECEGMNPHTPKWTPNGLPNFQRAIAGNKTHWFEKFFISLENY